MTMLVFSLFFGSRVGRHECPGPSTSPDPVFVYMGLLAWTLFSAIASLASLELDRRQQHGQQDLFSSPAYACWLPPVLPLSISRCRCS